MTQLSARDKLIIARILKVNHGGEHGAIRIYSAQLLIARKRFPKVVSTLEDMLRHEIEHHRLFQDAMPPRQAKPCRLLFLWSWGGFLLGFCTALLGERFVWICTEAVEDAVHHHLSDQLNFLNDRDPDLHTLIQSIQIEEQSHLDHARQSRGSESQVSRFALRFIAIVTDVLIWMSTSGDSARLKKELRRSAV
jgi:3-demethoxyubiquinol 3-hydroxylase